MTGIAVVIPVRSFEGGKSRLARLLSPEARSTLIANMLERVLTAVRESGVAAHTLVVSPDPAVRSFAQRIDRHVTAIAQPADAEGLNVAASLGKQTAIEQGCSRLLILFGDLPLLRPEDLTEFVTQSADLVVGTDWTGTGSNGLLMNLEHPAARVFSFAYGIESCHRHLAEAERLHMSGSTVKIDGIAYDLDTEDDFAAMRAGDREIPEWLRPLPIQQQEIDA
jgi:2-phospho-L-lactate guanylyltransferase